MNFNKSWICVFLIAALFSVQAMAGKSLTDKFPDFGFRYSISETGKTALILIHGNFGNMETWDQVRPALEKYFQVITFNLAGYGKSPNITNDYSLDAYVDQVSRLFEICRIKSAIIAGNSMGGAIAAAFVGKNPDKVKALILEDANYIPVNPEKITEAAFRLYLAVCALVMTAVIHPWVIAFIFGHLPMLKVKYILSCDAI